MSSRGDDPPYLSVGTEVSAKYKGAFCEAKIKKVQRCIKCRVTYKQGLGTAILTDDQIKGQIRIGALIEAKYNDRKDFVEATINKIQDSSQYTVVFDDGDITTLRRSALCLKSGRHFAESETLDQLPLTHPEHFGYPVTGRRGRRSRQNQDGSSEEEDDDGARGSNDSGSGSGGKDEAEREPEIGKVVCVELSGDKKKKDNWFPGLIVSPNAQETNKINIHEEYLVRSFRDSRFYTVPKKETTAFSRDLAPKVEHSNLKTAVEKAITYLDKEELPNHWDRDVLFGSVASSENSDSEEGDESPSSDDEPREEKDHVVATLYKFMDDRGTPINQCPMIGNEDIDLYKLFKAVYKLGGYNRVTNQNQWKFITKRLGFQVQNNQSTRNAVKNSYKRYLHSFEDFYRKLGCTMVNHPRGGRTTKQRPGRSLIRDRDRTTTPNQEQPIIKAEKEEEEKKPTVIPEDEIKKEKIKKESTPKEEEVQAKVKRKEEPAPDDDVSGQESDPNLDMEEESSSSERSQKSTSRLTPSSNISGKSKITVKNKEEALKKKSNVEKKKIETKKQDKKDEKIKEDDSTKTRSRSKDDVGKGSKSNPEVRETRTPSREPDKKVLAKPRRMTDDELKKRGRKKKDTEGEKGKTSEERSVPQYATLYKGPVEVGDKLNVYYGPTHDNQKVTYEAKVVDISKDGDETVYLVHYTGWNNRYDEWIKSHRIAKNFTAQHYAHGQSRLKRAKTTPRPQTPISSGTKSKTAPNAGTGSSPASQNRRRAQGDASSTGSTSSTSNRDTRKDEREATPTTRSMTPSPLITNVLRTKSPASTASNRSTRVTRNADSASSSDLSRRPRRSSGHADAIAVEESESEETDSLESDASVSTQVTSRSRIRGGQEKKNRREARKRAESRMKIEDVSDIEEKEVEEPRRGRRVRKPVGKLVEVKSEPESDEEQPKGRDFDLNQIRSELKGFDKAVKLEIPTVERDVEEEEEKPISIKQEKVDSENVTEKKITSEPEKKREIPKVEQQVTTPVKREVTKTDSNQPENTEDIYEFKEPEPFEFEVRNKRDSGGSSTSIEKEKDKDKDKPKNKQRPVEEDLKSPKKRTKPPFSTSSTTPIKVEPKSLTESSSTDQTIDAKKKVRKIFKKNDESEETAEAETVEEPITREPPKVYTPATYGSAMLNKRKGNFSANSTRSEENVVDESTTADSTIERVVAGDENGKSPKKRQPKTFSAAAAAAAKASETKREVSPMESTDAKKKVRKIFSKKPDEADDNDEDDEKELLKVFSNYSISKTPYFRKDVLANKAAPEPDMADESVNSKRTIEDDVAKSTKKKQKTTGVAAGKTDQVSSEMAEGKKKVVRKISKKPGDTEDNGGSESDEDLARKYFSHYSGPKGKATSVVGEAENTQDRLTTLKVEGQVNDPPKTTAMLGSTLSTVTKEDSKLKIGETTTMTTLVDSKQGPSSVIEKSRGDSTVLNKAESKSETKPLDFMPTVPQSLTVPAPLSARLPATASIEEKLSAAAVFRSKMKDTKKDDDVDITPRKLFKDVAKKTDTLSVKKAQKDKEESKVKHEPEKKKQQSTEQVVVKKDPLTEIEVRKDPLLEVMKKKDDDLLKVKKDLDSKTNLTSTVTTITKTYGNLRKEPPASKPEEVWKKAVAMASSASNIEAVASTNVPTEPSKDYPSIRKDILISKIKSSIDRDSVESTDSSDSERRLTIIDNEDFADDKGNESGSDTIRAKTTVISVPSTQLNSMSSQQDIKSIVISQVETPHQQIIGIVGNTVIQAKSTKIEEDGENLNSLLCEEEIPGSPTPGGESVEQEQKSTGSQTLVKTDLGSKVAVAFVAAQLPLSTVQPPTQLSSCTIVTTMSGGIPVPQVSSNIVPVAIQHLNIQPIRQHQIQTQLQIPQQHPLPQPIPPQIHQPHHPHHMLQPHHPATAIPIVLQQRRESNETNPVNESTPPTTPDSSISNFSNSPRNERTGGSTLSSSEDNSNKMHRDCSEAENNCTSNKSSGVDQRTSTIISLEMRGNITTATLSSDRVTKTPPKRSNVIDNDGATSPKKRKKRKDQDIISGPSSHPTPSSSLTGLASGKKSPRQSSSRSARHGSDSEDDTSDNLSSMRLSNNLAMTTQSNIGGVSITNGGAITNVMNPPIAAAAVSSVGPSISNQNWNWGYMPKSKYNLLPELDPSWTSEERIEALSKKIGEARKYFAEEQAKLIKYDKCMKKIKRKRREEQKVIERVSVV